MNVSNAFVITTGDHAQSPDEVFIHDDIHEIMEIVPTVPKLERIRAVLRGSEYGKESSNENSMEMDVSAVSVPFLKPYYSI